VIKKGAWNISETVQSAPLNSNEEAEIPLHNGWNLITNPFTIPVSWAIVQQVNGISEPIRDFDGSGSWPSSQFLNPYRGYYFFNSGNLDFLRIPFNPAISKLSVFDRTLWQVNIRLAAEEINKSSVSFGVADEAESGLDKMDYRKPRAIGSLGDLYFDRTEWDKNYSSFDRDIRPPISEIEIWPFKAVIPSLIQTTLVFNRLSEVPEEFDVYLIDKAALKFINLREHTKYGFTPVTETSEFEVLIGKNEYIIERLSNILPTEYALGRNFPNPFNPKTTIPFAMPEKAKVTLKVYNIIGQEISTIFKGILDAGRHYFTWNAVSQSGQRVSAGIYIYRLTTNSGDSFIGKMVLLK